MRPTIMKPTLFFITIALCMLVQNNGAAAANIKGHILDKNTKEALIGAVVAVTENMHYHDAAALDGSYIVKNVQPGTYHIKAQYIGYATQEQVITVKDANENITVEFMMDNASIDMKEVEIKAERDKETDSYARDLEKNNQNVANVLSAKTILLMPDVTVGAVLQRVSAITVSKGASGEGKSVTIRGMEKRYNYTLIDGIKLPSPDNKGRYIPMDIFPSDMVEHLEVIKSLTPNMEADATGGVMNLVLKTAPEKFLLAASFATGYDQELFERSYAQYNASLVNDQSPQQVHMGSPATLAEFPADLMNYKHIQPMPNILANFTVGDRFLKDKLGVLVAGGYQDIFTGLESQFISLDRQPNAKPLPNTPVFDDVEDRYYSREDKRWDVVSKLDYRFNNKHTLQLSANLVGMQQQRVRTYTDTLVSTNVGDISHHYETKTTNQSISDVSLKGIDTLAHNLFLDYNLAYGLANGSTPAWTTLSDDLPVGNNAFTWKSLDAKWQSNTDENISQYINLGYKFNALNQIVELQTGAMNRNTNRDNFYDEYSINLAPVNSTDGVSNIYQSTTSVSPQIVAPLGALQDPNNYTIHENVYAAYGMAKLILMKKLELLGGIRMEHTNQTYWDDESIYSPGQHGTKDYEDILPSAQIKYKINDRQFIRASYFASITRPDFFEIVPYAIAGEEYDERGNPYLKHSTADNLDLRYEFYPRPGEQLLAGVFYKNINNPIEQELVGSTAGPSAEFIQPTNNATPATNYGFELVASKMIHYFGIQINYTYTQSTITIPKTLYYINSSNTESAVIWNQTEPLQGQADHIANVSLLYKNPNKGWNIALTLNYTGRFVSFITPDYGLDLWQMPTTNLNLSVEKKISKKYNISVFAKIKNILNSSIDQRLMQAEPVANQLSYAATPTKNQYLPWQNTTSSVLMQRDIYGQGYLAGIRYKF